MKGSDASLAALAAALLPMVALADDPSLSFTKLWTYSHAPIAGQVSEIPAYDPKTRTLWIAGIVGVDILDAATGPSVDHTTRRAMASSTAWPSTTAWPRSQSNRARAPTRARCCSTARAAVRRWWATTRSPSARCRTCWRSCPMAGSCWSRTRARRRPTAHESAPACRASTPMPWGDPAGSVSIIEVRRGASSPRPPGSPACRRPAATCAAEPGMDFEPEYLAFDAEREEGLRHAAGGQCHRRARPASERVHQRDRPGRQGLQPAGQPDRSAEQRHYAANDRIHLAGRQGLLHARQHRQPTSGAARRCSVMANEGDFREDDADRSAASGLGAIAPLNNLRVSNSDSSPWQSLRRRSALVLDPRHLRAPWSTTAATSSTRKPPGRGIYDYGRSRDKGVEPEGVALRQDRWSHLRVHRPRACAPAAPWPSSTLRRPVRRVRSST